jgi:hypothetical protein
MSKKNDYIKSLFNSKHVSESYAETEAKLRKAKIKIQVEAVKGNLVLLVTKKGHEFTSGHVGKVTAVTENDYTFMMKLNGKEVEQTLPYNFLDKQGLITVGFYKVK